MPSVTDCGISFRQYGPSKIPVNMYAVTLGSRSRLVIRVAANPQNSISATEMMTIATPDADCNFS